MEKYNKHNIILDILKTTKNNPRVFLSWNKESFCIYSIYTNKKNNNIYKNVNILLNTHNSNIQKYTIVLPTKMYVETANTYINIEGIKKKTKISMTHTNILVDLKFLFSKINRITYGITNNITNTVNIRMPYLYTMYINKLKYPNTNLQKHYTPRELQYTEYIKKIINHQTKYAIYNNLEYQYTYTSFITDTYTANSPIMWDMHKKIVTEQYMLHYYEKC